MSNSTFGSRARALLEERHSGKPMRLVAEETGLHYITLNNALNDETSPRYATIRALGYYLDCPVKYLIDGTGPSSNVKPNGSVVTQAKREAARKVRAMESGKPKPKRRRRGRPAGSGPRQAEFIKAVNDSPGLTAKELSDKMGIKQQYVYRLARTVKEVEKREKWFFPKGYKAVLPSKPKGTTAFATTAAVNNPYRDGYRDGYADAIKMLAERPMSVEQFAAANGR